MRRENAQAVVEMFYRSNSEILAIEEDAIA